MTESGSTIDVQRESVGDREVLKVRGEVDLHTSPQFRLLLSERVEEGKGPLLVDLAGVGYMDSSGVGTLVYVKREVERKGRKFVLISPQQRVLSVLEITHLDKFFTIVDSVDEVAGE
jgi:anti-sigma B factor antagonist